MTDVRQNIGTRIRDVMAELMDAAVQFNMSREAAGKRKLAKANTMLASLRVQIDQVTGPVRLPPVKRGR